jgi:hypothetical protein
LRGGDARAAEETASTAHASTSHGFIMLRLLQLPTDDRWIDLEGNKLDQR